MDDARGDQKRVAGRNDVFLVADPDDVLALEDVLFVLDLVGVSRHLRAGREGEAPHREARRAIALVEQDALREALGGLDGLVLDRLAPTNDDVSGHVAPYETPSYRSFRRLNAFAL